MAGDHGRCEEWFTILSEHVDGELDSGKMREVCAHLEDCIPCARYLASLRATRDSLCVLDRDDDDGRSRADLLEECLRELKSRMGDFRKDST